MQPAMSQSCSDASRANARFVIMYKESCYKENKYNKYVKNYDNLEKKNLETKSHE